MKRSKQKTLYALLIFSLAADSRANGISAIMGLAWIHLLFGNALLGVIEGLMIGWIFKVSRPKSVAWMILANYLSMAVVYFGSAQLDINLYNAMRWAFWVPILCFASTLILEWPFCFLALLRVPKKFLKSIAATLLVNTVTYLLLIPFYADASDHSLFRLARADPQIVAQCDLPATVCFMSLDQKSLFQIGINGKGLKKIGELPKRENSRIMGLFAQPSSQEDGHWEIWIKSWKQGFGDTNTKVFDLPPGVIASDWNYRAENKENSMSNVRAVLPADLQSPWSVKTWDYRWGLFIENRETGLNTRLNFESPIIMFWHSSSPTLLPENKVVYQLDDQIVLLDSKAMKIGLITNGWYPLVVLDQTSK